MINYIKYYIQDKTASILPMTALMLPLILSAAGLGIDVGMWTMDHRNLQTAADAAVIAGAWEIANNNEDNAEAAALKEAAANGFSSSAGGEINIEIGQTESGDTTISATLSQPGQRYLSNIVLKQDISLSAQAMAGISSAGEHCFLSLDDEADGAVTVNGNVDIDSEACGLAVNSSSDKALDIKGNVDIDIGDVNLSGDYSLTGNSDFNYSSLKTHASKIQDPYSDLEVPSVNYCDENNYQISGNGNKTMSPGVYCGGISISGNTNVELEDGVYIVDGGDFNISGNGSLYGENVTIIMTSTTGSDWGTMSLTGGKDIYIRAPGEGEDWAGIAFYIDRNAPEAHNKMAGNGAVEFDGVFYSPSQSVSFGGNKQLSNPQSSCTHIVAKTMKFHGNPYMQNDCEGMGVRDIGSPSVRLML